MKSIRTSVLVVATVMALLPLRSTTAQQSNTADYRILYYGNSHTVGHDIPGLVAKMIATDGSGEVAYTEFGGFFPFLDEAWQHPGTRAAIASRPWTHVVLQAQKYSQSGKFNYSTQEAIDMAKFIQERDAVAIYFPEWGQRGNSEEGRRVHKLHQSMADESGATVAPVGLAWDTSLANPLKVKLHAQDGNHATPFGAFLTAAVLYSTITGRSPEQIDSSVMPKLRNPDRAVLLDAAAKACVGNRP